MHARNFIAAMTAATGFALALPAQAQQPLPPRPVTQTTGPTTPDTPVISMEFAGGTLEQFVAAIRGSTKDPVNIVLQGDASKIVVDGMKLREVSVEAALRAGLEPRIGSTEMRADGSQSRIVLETIRTDGQSKPVYVVGVQTAPGPTRAAVPGTMGPVTEVLSIQRLVRAEDGGGAAVVPEAVVLSAIDAGLKLNRAEGEAKPEVNYHKDSGLLLVRGQVNDVRLVQEIVRRMVDDQQRRASDAQNRRKAEISLDAAMQRAQIALELSQTRREAARAGHLETEKAAAAGSVPTSMVRAAEMEVAQAEAEFRMAQVEMKRIRQEAEAGIERESGASSDAAQLQAELGKALQRIKELEDQAAKGAASGKGKSKGE